MSVKISGHHEGHRKRLKGRFLKSGLKDFEDHNVLELLLFYAVPYKDTNELAHKLIDRFGSIERVFESDFDELCKVEGVGENIATLIKLVPQISKYYFDLKHQGRDRFDGLQDLAQFLQHKYAFEDREVFSVLCLDSQGGFVGFEMLQAGTTNLTEVSIVKAVQIALRYNASCVVVAHNHPGGGLEPSVEDISTTRRLSDAFAAVSVKMIDHIIVTYDGFTSMANEKHFASIFK